MSYYGTGDYYMAGDPGLLSSLGGLVHRGFSAITAGLTGGPVAAGRALVAPAPRSQAPISIRTPGGGSVQPLNFLPGGVPLYSGPRRKRRRMNYTNGKALARANRRMDGFVREAKKVLKHTNYKLVSKSAGKTARKGGRVFKESGAGDLIVG